jgi:seryl-tRNA synthetase
MLTLTTIREQRDAVIQALSKRGIDVSESIDKIIALDAERRSLQKELDDTLASSNDLSRQIGGLMKEGKRDEAEAIKSQTAGLKEKSGGLREKMLKDEEEINDLLSHIPNTPAESVVAGKSEEDNEIVGSWGEKPDLGSANKPQRRRILLIST